MKVRMQTPVQSHSAEAAGDCDATGYKFSAISEGSAAVDEFEGDELCWPKGGRLVPLELTVSLPGRNGEAGVGRHHCGLCLISACRTGCSIDKLFIWLAPVIA